MNINSSVSVNSKVTWGELEELDSELDELLELDSELLDEELDSEDEDEELLDLELDEELLEDPSAPGHS